MRKIIFYEKTGCINNTKQKKLLSLAGLEVEAIDIIEHQWSLEELLLFFDGLDVKQWFNPHSPRIISGDVRPEKLSRNEALQALLNDHLLIKRPLMIIESHRLVGFDMFKIGSFVRLNTSGNNEIITLMNENLIDCPRKSSGSSCS